MRNFILVCLIVFGCSVAFADDQPSFDRMISSIKTQHMMWVDEDVYDVPDIRHCAIGHAIYLTLCWAIESDRDNVLVADIELSHYERRAIKNGSIAQCQMLHDHHYMTAIEEYEGFKKHGQDYLFGKIDLDRDRAKVCKALYF